MAKLTHSEKAARKTARERELASTAYEKKMKLAWYDAGCPDSFEFEGKTHHSLGLFSELVAKAKAETKAAPKPQVQSLEIRTLKLAQGMHREHFEPLETQVLKLWHADKSSAKDLGLALLKVKAALDHGQFKPWWLALGLKQSRVSYCMGVALGFPDKAAEEEDPFADTTPRSKGDRKAVAIMKRCAALIADKTFKLDHFSLTGSARADLVSTLITTSNELRKRATDLATPPAPPPLLDGIKAAGAHA